MPRKARKKSSMNVYHVILRGINQQIIFEDKHDHVQFISIMKHYKELCGFKLYAYCLMDNHVHLLIEDADIPLDEIMKKIEVKFVRWYNRKSAISIRIHSMPGWKGCPAYIRGAVTKRTWLQMLRLSMWIVYWNCSAVNVNVWII